mgnify:CR=1 FL=1
MVENTAENIAEKLVKIKNISDFYKLSRVYLNCLLYTSDAADERSSVDLGGRRIIKKKTQNYVWDSASTTTENKTTTMKYTKHSREKK